jgi:branched-chain amino acid transport system permease protein
VTTALGYYTQQGLNALFVGAFYSLLAVAYALVHTVTGRIVLCFGDVMTFGALYAVYAFVLATALGLFGVAALLAMLAIAIAGTALSGAALNRLALQPLFDKPSQALMIASVGAGIVISETLRAATGGREQWLAPMLTETAIGIAGEPFSVRISMMQLSLFLLAILLVAALFLILGRTRYGRLWRATAEDPRMAALLGIDTGRVMAFSVMVSASFAAAAGFIVAAYYGGVSFYMGLVFGLKALFSTLIGGVGSIAGAVLGAFVLAGFETAWTTLFRGDYRDVAVFALVIAIFLLKPEGLLGQPLRRDTQP